MKPLTAILLEALGPAAVGIPYSSCRHVGVMEVAHDAGAALDVRLPEELSFLNLGALVLITAKLVIEIRLSLMIKSTRETAGTYLTVGCTN